MLVTNCNVQGTTANLPSVFHQTQHIKKISQRKVKIHLLARRQMWMHWEAVRALSSRVWFIITQQLKHSPQMQVDSTFVTMKDFDTYWSQGKDTEWWCWAGCSAEALSLSSTVAARFQPVLACSAYLLKINSEIACDAILFAFIPPNCSLQKIILIIYLPWNKLSEWKITSGLQSDKQWETGEGSQCSHAFRGQSRGCMGGGYKHFIYVHLTFVECFITK